MSCNTRAPIPGHRRLTLVALRAHLDVLQARADELADLVPNWIPRGSDRQRLKWCRQERRRTAKAIKACRRQLAAAGGTP